MKVFEEAHGSFLWRKLCSATIHHNSSWHLENHVSELASCDKDNTLADSLLAEILASVIDVMHTLPMKFFGHPKGVTREDVR